MVKSNRTEREFNRLLDKELSKITEAYEKYIGRDHDYYLSLTCIETNGDLYLTANNEHWEGGREAEHPVNWYRFRQRTKYVNKDMYDNLWIENEDKGCLFSGTFDECAEWIERNKSVSQSSNDKPSNNNEDKEDEDEANQ